MPRDHVHVVEQCPFKGGEGLRPDQLMIVRVMMMVRMMVVTMMLMMIDGWTGSRTSLNR